MQLLIMQFSPASCHFLPLRSKYSPKCSILCSQALSICVLTLKWESGFAPIQKKIIIFSNSRREVKRLWNSW
jgi:hypothetical protein